MGITLCVYRKYTVIVEGMGAGDMTSYHYVEALSKEARDSGASSETIDQHDATVVSAMDDIERLIVEHYRCR